VRRTTFQIELSTSISASTFALEIQQTSGITGPLNIMRILHQTYSTLLVCVRRTSLFWPTAIPGNS
jgi:hypothetical protein